MTASMVKAVDLANEVKSAVVQKTHITVSFKDGKTFSIDSSQPTFKKLKLALKKNKTGAAARKLINAAEAVKTWAEGKLTITGNDEVRYGDKLVDRKMHARILTMVRQGSSVTTLVKFLDNLYANPSVDSITDLYDFLEANDLPLTEDGCFLAFKAVRHNYTDHHTGKYDNSVGAKCKMPREQCELNRMVECSSGFHFCRYGYLSVAGMGGKTMLVKVNPKNVTSIPLDYSRQKGRCCELEFIAEVKQGVPLAEVFKTAATLTAHVKRVHGAPKAEKKPAVKKVPTKKLATAAKKIVKTAIKQATKRLVTKLEVQKPTKKELAHLASSERVDAMMKAKKVSKKNLKRVEKDLAD